MKNKKKIICLVLIFFCILLAFKAVGIISRGLLSCGDGVCNPLTEDCTNCLADCGACPNCETSCPEGYNQLPYPDCSCSLIPSDLIFGRGYLVGDDTWLKEHYILTQASSVLPYAHLITSLNSNIIPDTDDARDLGSSTKRWGEVYAPVGRSATFLVAASDASARMKAQADYVCDGTDDQVQILAAIAALPSSGGTVMLSEGEFSLRASIKPTSNVILRGQGPGTVLKPVAAANITLSADGVSGNSFVDVTTPSSFAVGMGIWMADATGFGTFTNQAVITDITGNRVTFAGSTLDRDYNVADNACLINAFYPIHANTSFENIIIKDLTIDGNWNNIDLDAPHIIPLIGLNSDYSKVINSWILNSTGDGIIIGGDYSEVRNSIINNSNGVGLHPGSYAKGARLIGNTVTNHNDYGLYYCAGVTGSIVSGNVFRYNYYGVGGLGATDYYNILSGNDISYNDWRGITNTLSRTFTNFIITDNVIMNNGQEGPGTSYQVHLYGPIDKLIFINNIIGDDQASATAYGGLRFQAGTVITNSTIENNILFGHTDDIFGNAAAPMMEESKWDIYLDVLAESLNHVGKWAGTGVQQVITTGITDPDVPRNLLINSTNNAAPSGDVIISGLDSRGSGIAETVTISAGNTVTLDSPFATITQIIIPATVGATDNIAIGIGSNLGLSRYIRGSTDVFKVKQNTFSLPAANYSVNTTYYTVNVSAGAPIAAGDDFTIYYKQNLNILAS